VPEASWLADWQVRRRQTQKLLSIGLHEYVIRLPNRPENCNCHGWVFTGGQFWVKCEDVPMILQDNGYRPVHRPEADDLAVYCDDSGQVMHTGVVRYASSEEVVLVESKWGRADCFLHLHDKLGYGYSTCTFYRSPRPGHLLRGLDAAEQDIAE
jgi:hypothetical protein